MTDLPLTTQTPLSKDDTIAFMRLIGRTPVVALPGSGMNRKPETVEDLYKVLDSVTAYLRAAMERQKKAEDQRNEIVADLAAAGRVLKLITGSQDDTKLTSVFAEIRVAMMARPAFDVDALHEIAEHHGVQL